MTQEQITELKITTTNSENGLKIEAGGKSIIEMPPLNLNFENNLPENRILEITESKLNTDEAILLEFISTGNIDSVLDAGFQLLRLPIPPISRAIEFYHPQSNQFYSLNGIGAIESTDEGNIRLNDFDLAEGIHNYYVKNGVGAQFGGTVYIKEDGGFDTQIDNTQIGVQPYERLLSKISKTDLARNIFGQSAVVPEYLSWGYFNDGRLTQTGEKLGWSISKLPAYAYPEEIKFVEKNNLSPIAAEYFKKKYTAARSFHDAGFVHYQMTSTNTGLAFINGSLVPMFKDFETTRELPANTNQIIEFPLGDKPTNADLSRLTQFIKDPNIKSTLKEKLQESKLRMSASPRSIAAGQDLAMMIHSDLAGLIGNNNNNLSNLFFVALNKIVPSYLLINDSKESKNQNNHIGKKIEMVLKLMGKIDSMETLVSTFSKVYSTELSAKRSGEIGYIEPTKN